MDTDWNTISGSWQDTQNTITHLGNNMRFPDSLILKKDVIIDGDVQLEMKFNSFKNPPPNGPHGGGIVFRYQSPSNYYFAGVGGYKQKFVIGKRLPQGSYALNSYGMAEDIEKNNKYSIRLEIRGKRFTLFLNGKKGKIRIIDAIDTNEPFYNSGNVGLMVYDNEDISFTNYSYEEQKPKCFIIIPFKDKKLKKLKIQNLIKTCASKRLKPYLANEIYDIQPIILDIIESIDTSILVIAEITKDNANVFYEVGIAHAKNSNVILICDEIRRKILPFDLAHIRVIFYNSKNFNEEHLKQQVCDTIDTIMDRTVCLTQERMTFK